MSYRVASKSSWATGVLPLSCLLALLGISSTVSAQTVAISQKSSSTVYADYATKSRLRGTYVAFQVTPSGGNVADMWVKLENFSGPQLSLASGEDGLVHFGAVNAGVGNTAFFYLFAAAASTTAESYQVAVYDGHPNSGGTLVGSKATVNVVVNGNGNAIEDTIQAQANKVTSGTVSVGNGPYVGGTVTVTVVGQTGTVNNSQGTAHFSPATSEAWPADVLELQSTSIVLSNGSAGNGTYTNTLTLSGLSGAYDYTATYVFRIVGTKSAASPVSPTAYIASGGTQHKHTAVNSFGNVPPIPPTSLSAWMSKSVNKTLVTTGSTVTYSIDIHNTGATAITLDQIVDTLPSGASYVNGTSVYDGNAVADPSSANGVLTWSQLSTGVAGIAVAAGSTKTLAFNVTIPSTAGTYRNTAYGKVGSTTIYAGLTGTTQAYVDVVVNATASPDLTISKTHTGTMTAGQVAKVPFVITVSNSGSQATAGTNGTVTVTDSMPTGMTALLADITATGWTCSVSGQTITCTRGDQLALNSSYPTITVNASIGGTIAATATNTATVSGGGESSVSLGNNSAADTFIVARQYDLLVSKTHLFNFTTGSVENNAYSISVTNIGNAATASQTVAITDALPTGWSVQSGSATFSGTGWTCSSTTLTCTRDAASSLAAFSSYPPITLLVNVPSTDAGTTKTNTVRLCPSGPCTSASNVGGTESDVANNTATDSTAILPTAIDLIVSKRHSDTFTQGATGRKFLIDITNNSSSTDATATMTAIDTLPSGLTYASASGTGWSCSASGQVVTCTNATDALAGYSLPTLTLGVNVASDAATSLTNSVTVSGGGELAAQNGNNTATDGISVTSTNPDLTIGVTHIGEFTQLTTEQFTATVTNAGGASTTAQVTFSDTLPTGLTPTGALGTGWTCSITGQTVSCTRTAGATGGDALAAGASYPSITVSVVVAANASTSLNNTVSVSGGGESNTSNNTAVDAIAVSSGAELSVSITDSGASFVQGQNNGSYTVTVTNNGNTASSGTISATATLPAQLTPTAGSGTDWTCNAAGQVLTCTRTTAIAAGGSASFSVTVAVDAGATIETKTTNAGVSGGGDIDTSNNAASDTTPVVAGGGTPDLIVAMAHSGNFSQGQTGKTYTVTVTNNGNGLSSGQVTATATMVTGLTATAASGSGWSCAIAGSPTVVTCTTNDVWSPGQNKPFTVTVNVASNAGSPLVPTASVSGGSDGNNGNNTASDSTVVEQPPSVTTTAATSLTSTGATLNGTVNANSLATTVSFIYGTSATLASGTTTTAAAQSPVTGSSNTSVSLVLTGLTPGTTYYFKVRGASTAGTVDGAILSFTSSAAAPTVATSAVTALAPTTVTLNGTVNANGASTTASFVYGTDANLAGATTTAAAQSPVTGTSNTSISLDLTGLLPATKYYYRATGTNSAGTGNGNILTFTTPAAAPAVTTTAASGVAATTATVNGTVTANGASTTVEFDYGTDASLAGATTTAAAQSPVTGTSSSSVSLGLSGLTPTTKYYFRVKGSNSEGTATGTILNFTTPAAAPAVTTTAATSVAATAATLNGTVNANGATTTASFVYGTDANLSGATTTAATQSPVAGTTNTTISLPLTGLLPGKTYYYRATGTNSEGTINGAILNFTTPATAPSATTNAATNVDGTSVTLNGSVTANGASTTVTFVYGTVADLSSGTTSVTADQSPLTGNTATVVTAAVTGLTKGTTYYYKVVGANSVGSADGAIVSFTTRKIDLKVAMTHAGNFTQGATSGASYTVSVSNIGTTVTSGVATVTITIPSGLTAGTASGTSWTCTTSGATVTCTRADPLGASASYQDITLPVTVAPLAAASLTATAEVSGGGDEDASNNKATDVTAIAGAPDIRVAMTHTGNFTQGQSSGATYKVTVSNAGRGTSSGKITAAVTIPTGLTPVSATGADWTCTISGPSVSCERSDALAGGASFPDITITVRVSSTADTPLEGKVTVSGGGDVDTTNNSGTDSTVVDGAPELRIALAPNGSIRQGTTAATYNVTVSNAGRGASTGTITVNVTFPVGMTPKSAKDTDWACTAPVGQTVSCFRATSIAAGATAIPIVATFDVAANATATLTTTATVEGGGDTDTTNNRASHQANVSGGPNLKVTVTAKGDFVQGRTGTFEILVANIGQSASEGAVNVSVTLPKGYTLKSASGTGWTCTSAGQVVTCTRPDSLAAGSSFPLAIIEVEVDRDAPTRLDTPIKVSGGGDVDSSDNEVTDIRTIGPGPNLRVTVARVGEFTQGQSGAKYTIAVDNTGKGPTSGPVTVSTTLPEGLTPTAASGDGWTCTISGRTVSCTRPDVLNGERSFPLVTITVDVARNALPILDVVVSVSGGGDVDTSDNTATDKTPIKASVARADIGLTISAIPPTLRSGETTTILLTVINNGPDLTQDVKVNVLIPPGLTAGTATAGQGTYVAASGDWSIGSLASGASTTLSMPGALTATASPTVLATKVASRAFDPSNANDSASVTINPTRSADIGVSIDATDAYPPVGTSITITVTAMNRGPENAADVIVSARVPTGLAVTSHAASTGRFDAASGRWTIGSLTVGGVVTLTLDARVDAAGVLTTASRVLRTNLPDDNPLNDYTTFVVNGSDATSLYLTKTTSRREVAVADQVGITTIVTNDGPATVQNLVVSDSLPNSLNFVASRATQGTYDPGTGLWTVGAMAPGERRALTLVATVVKEGSITSTARLHSGYGSDPLGDDDIASVTISAVPVADIEVTIDAPERALVGKTGQYIVRVRNIGPSDASGVAVTAGSPYGLSFVSALQSTGTYVAGSGEWTIGAMPAGAIQTLTISAQILNENVVVRAARTKGDQFDPVIANNQAAAVPAGANWADVQIDVSADSVDPQIGDPLQITLRVRNQGPKAATGVTAKLPLPAGYTVATAQASAGSYSASTGVFTVGALAVDGEASVVIRGTVAASGPLVFIASKTASEPFDPVAANDESGAAVNAQIADLQVVTTVDKTEPLMGERITITTVVTNNSRTTASGVSINAKLPGGLRYVKHTATSGVYDIATGKWNLGAVPQAGPTGNATLAIVAVVTSRDAINAIASLGGLDQVDLVSANNSSAQTVAGSGWSTFQTDLALETRVTPQLATAGGVLTYTVTATNRGPTYTTDLSITGAVPDQTTLMSLTPTAGAECTAPAAGARGTITCSWPDVTRLESRGFTLAVRVNSDPREGSTIAASFSTAAPIGEYYPPNNFTITSVSVLDGSPIDLDVTAAAQFGPLTATALTVPVNSEGVVRFTVRNNGGVTLTAARLAIQGLDVDELVIQGAQPSRGQLVATPQGAEWTIAALAPATSATLDLFVRVQGMRSSAISMRRAESTPGDLNARNDTATVVLDGIGRPSVEGRMIAAGNIDGAAGDELIITGGHFETPFVSTVRANGSEVRFIGFDRRFVGGLRLATCDVDGDGINEMILGSGPHGGPHLRVMRVRATELEEIVGFYTFEPSFDLGITVACVDTDGDKKAEIIAARSGRSPEVAVFAVERRVYRLVTSFMAYEPTYAGGVHLSALPASLAGAAGADFQFATAPAGPGRPFEIKTWKLTNGVASVVKSLVPAPIYTQGAFIAIGDLDQDGKIDIVASTPSNVDPILGILSYTTGQLVGLYRPFAGMANVSGIHIAIGKMAGASEPWLFVTPAEGQALGVDAYKLVNGALQFVARASVVESP